MNPINSTGIRTTSEYPQEQQTQQTEEQSANSPSVWSKYDGHSVGGQANGLIEEEELNNYINDRSNELGTNIGDTNLRVGAEFKRLAGAFIGEKWENAYQILDNMARQAINNIRGQVAKETNQKATQVPTEQSDTDWQQYDGEKIGGVSNEIIDEKELLNFINDQSNKLGMNLGDNNKRVGEEFIKLAGGFVGQNWNNSMATLERIARLAVNNVRGQVASETGSETTQVPNKSFGL